MEQEFQGIVDVLSTLVAMGIYGPVDRIAGALTSISVESALYDAIRSIEAMARQSSRLKLKVDEKELDLEVIDYTKDLDDPRYFLARKGIVVEVIRGGTDLTPQTEIKYVPKPRLPTQDEIDRFIQKVRSGISGLEYARMLAMRALSPYR